MERAATLPCGAARGAFSLSSRRGPAGRRRRRMPPPSREERSGRDHGAIRARRPRARSQRKEGDGIGGGIEASLARPPRRVNARDASTSWKRDGGCQPAHLPPPCRHLAQ